MNPFERQYAALLNQVIDKGESHQGKRGFGSFMIPYGEIRLNLSTQPFPILSGRAIDITKPLVEIIGNLRGINNAQWYKERGCGFWSRFGVSKTVTATVNKSDEELKNEYCSCAGQYLPTHPIYRERFKALSERSYLEGKKLIDQADVRFFKDVTVIEKGDMGPTHAYLWRNWKKQNGDNFDQLRHVFDTLASHPDRQQLTITGILPIGMEEFHEQYSHLLSLEKSTRFPCHLFHTYNTAQIPFDARCEQFFARPDKAPLREKYQRYPKERMTEILDKHRIPTYYLDLTWGQQNWDLMLGLPMNTASYAAMLIMMASLHNMTPRYLRGVASSMHIYKNHLSGASELLERYRENRLPKCKPKLTLHLRDEITFIDELTVEDFTLTDYKALPAVKPQYAYNQR